MHTAWTESLIITPKGAPNIDIVNNSGGQFAGFGTDTYCKIHGITDFFSQDRLVKTTKTTVKADNSIFTATNPNMSANTGTLNNEIFEARRASAQETTVKFNAGGVNGQEYRFRVKFEQLGRVFIEQQTIESERNYPFPAAGTPAGMAQALVDSINGHSKAFPRDEQQIITATIDGSDNTMVRIKGIETEKKIGERPKGIGVKFWISDDASGVYSAADVTIEQTIPAYEGVNDFWFMQAWAKPETKADLKPYDYSFERNQLPEPGAYYTSYTFHFEGENDINGSYSVLGGVSKFKYARKVYVDETLTDKIAILDLIRAA